MSEKTPPAKKGRANGAETGRRLLDVLMLFSSAHPKWSIQELADTTGFSLSTTYRYASVLRDAGFLERDENALYRVSDFATVLAEAARAGRPPLAERVQPIIERIRDSIDESVFLARRAGWTVIMVAREESRSPVRLQFEPGRPMLLHSGSLSRVLLAELSPSERARFLSTLDSETAARPLLSPSSLDEVKARGVTESFEEVDEGIWGVAAVVRIPGEEPLALGCAAPLYRSDEATRARIRSFIEQGAKDIAEMFTPA